MPHLVLPLLGKWLWVRKASTGAFSYFSHCAGRLLNSIWRVLADKRSVRIVMAPGPLAVVLSLLSCRGSCVQLSKTGGKAENPASTLHSYLNATCLVWLCLTCPYIVCTLHVSSCKFQKYIYMLSWQYTSVFCCDVTTRAFQQSSHLSYLNFAIWNVTLL